jgi:hypothetical protein
MIAWIAAAALLLLAALTLCFAALGAMAFERSDEPSWIAVALPAAGAALALAFIAGWTAGS